MYEVHNKLPQPIPLMINGQTYLLKQNGFVTVNEITSQIDNLIKKNFLRIKEKK